MSNHMRSIAGSNLTVLGFGNIGEWIGKYAKPFGVNVTGVKRNPCPKPDWFTDADRIVTTDSLCDILPNTDHLAVCLPSGKETDRIINAETLRNNFV